MAANPFHRDIVDRDASRRFVVCRQESGNFETGLAHTFECQRAIFASAPRDQSAGHQACAVLSDWATVRVSHAYSPKMVAVKNRSPSNVPPKNGRAAT